MQLWTYVFVMILLFENFIDSLTNLNGKNPALPIIVKNSTWHMNHYVTMWPEEVHVGRAKFNLATHTYATVAYSLR